MKLRILLPFLAFSMAVPVSFSQTVVQHWRMGEIDPGAVAGNAVNATLTASIGNNLTRLGTSLSYTADTAPNLGGLAVDFTSAGNYTTASNLGLTKNFAMETWVNFSNFTGNQWVVLVGNGASQGVGIFYLVAGQNVGGAVAGVGGFASSGVLTLNTWYHGRS